MPSWPSAIPSAPTTQSLGGGPIRSRLSRLQDNGSRIHPPYADQCVTDSHLHGVPRTARTSTPTTSPPGSARAHRACSANEGPQVQRREWPWGCSVSDQQVSSHPLSNANYSHLHPECKPVSLTDENSPHKLPRKCPFRTIWNLESRFRVARAPLANQPHHKTP
jgi:hypothetical protein